MDVKDFIQNEDYYLEEGRVVFTAKYLTKRGFCCGNDCRHCPYTERIKNNTTLRETENKKPQE